MESLLIAIPASIAAGAAWRASRRVKTANGMTVGEMVEETHETVKELDKKVDAHIMDSRIH